nr:MAG TPA: hypothetical protein [Caudoviricetes sp.]
MRSCVVCLQWWQVGGNATAEPSVILIRQPFSELAS